MLKKRLLWRLFSVYFGITLFSLIAIALLATKSVRDFYFSQAEEELKSIANLVRQQVGDQFPLLSVSELDSISILLGSLSASRVTFVDRTGRVLGDTAEDPSLMENHADRPEIKAALKGVKGVSTRFSTTLKTKWMYLTLPIINNDTVIGVVRVSRSITEFDNALKQVYRWIIASGIVIGLIAVCLSYFILKKISKPLEEMKQDAEWFAKGELNHRLVIPSTEELGNLAVALNEMANQLRERITTITRQRNELEAVLSSMVEGVITVDPEERISRINKAAAGLLKVEEKNAQERSIQEVIANPDFQQFVIRTLKSREKLEDEIILYGGETYLQVHGTQMIDPEGKEIGALIVLHDVTHLRKLENLRREFVANVSHELRTPITSIRGFVETLRDGALNNKEDASHFMEIIIRQTDRLNALIEDLLSLSRIEQKTEREEIVLEKGDIRDVLFMAVESKEIEAKSKGVGIVAEDLPSCMAMINSPLLEQAVGNLIDNAINYSQPQSKIILRLQRDPSEITIIVEDQGIGISAEHLHRLFERFYRVDKDRNRKVGGTGLGLAIVKHIALAHGGRVSVDSKLGQGSTFRIHLPITN